MQKRNLGRGGLQVSALSLGCMGYAKARLGADRQEPAARADWRGPSKASLSASGLMRPDMP